MNRIEKATKYMETHKAKKCYVEMKKVILKDLEVIPNCNTVKGSTYGFVKAICNRFKRGFFPQEYMDILTGLTTNYTEKQTKFYNWV